MKIGSYSIDIKTFLAPLSGVSDLAFRLICREGGANFAFYEMLDANSMVYNRARSLAMLASTPEDSPVGAQLLGTDPAMMLEAAEVILDASPKTKLIDVNCACPARKVVKKKAGAALLRDPKKIYAIVRKLAKKLPVPVTVKLRIGAERKEVKTIQTIARGCERAGAAALFVHGRMGVERYADEVDYSSIRAVKEAVSVPVVGSGNILGAGLAKRMLDETGCDGVLVARGAMGNPWICKEIERYLATGRAPAAPTALTRKRAFKRHLAYCERFKDPRYDNKVGCMRKVSMWYVKGFPGAAGLRYRVGIAKTYGDLIEIADSLPS